ncbi:50S ribosomal protein L30 [Candidatus Woesearchaeota archaeon]|nr:50S ribosomal protein L30 [Candidatus Woesearchaeota archaeon]
MEQKSETGASKQLAAIRVRGLTGIKININDTLKMLRLYKNNYCCILPNTPAYAGMLKKAKDYITWGEINDETFNLLVNKRGEEFKGREIDSSKKIKYSDYFIHNNKKLKRFFNLNPPRKGFGRKGVKHPFQSGGALGYRGEAINELIKRMV